MTSDAAQGTIRAQRTIRRPGNRLFRNWASPSETPIVTATTSTTQITVLSSTWPRAGSWNNVLKLLNPAAPSENPIELNLMNDVLIISIAGYTMIRAIRIRLGPSQPLGLSRRPGAGARPRPGRGRARGGAA